MSFWRREDPILDENGRVVTGGMWEHQRQWWDSKSFIKALVTGYGGGKTFIGAKRSVSIALHNAPMYGQGEICPHLIVSPSYKVAKRTIIPALKALLRGKQTLLRGFTYEHHRSDLSFSIWYKGREGLIWIGSGDDPDSLKGPNIGSALVDEPFIQSEEVLDQMLARVRAPNARKLEIGLTGTPEELNWGYDICEGDRKEDYDVEVFHASTKDNLALAETYAQRLERAYTDEASKAYVDGLFVPLSGGTVYYGFNERHNVIRLPDPGCELGVGMDFNVNPMAAVIFWVQGNHMHIMKEIELPNADTEYMCSYLLEMYHDKEGRCRITTVYPDATGANRSTKSPGGKSDFHYIEKAGFKVDAPPSNPPIRDRENAVNGKFKPRDGSEHPTLTIDPDCKKLIGYFRKYNHKERNTTEGKKMSHLIDSFGYPVHRLFPIVKPEIKLVRVHGA